MATWGVSCKRHILLIMNWSFRTLIWKSLHIAIFDMVLGSLSIRWPAVKSPAIHVTATLTCIACVATQRVPTAGVLLDCGQSRQKSRLVPSDIRHPTEDIMI